MAPSWTRRRSPIDRPPSARILTFSLLLLTYVVISLFMIRPVAGAAEGRQYAQLAGVLDTRTQFSDGIYSIDGLAKMAEERGIQILFINDHDKIALSYGLPPLPNIINKTVAMNSILKGKAADYLQAIRQTEERYKNVIIIPGTESAAFYYWTGNPFNKNLTAHNHERRLLTVGLAKADDYRRLPVVHNTGPLNMELLPNVVPFLAAFVLASVMIIWRGWMRITGIVLAFIALLFMIDNHPFRASVFDPFHGDQGVMPYQRLIDYVESRGGFTFWNYPETQSGVRRLGPIHVSTKPYPEMLLATQGYTGFAALYGDAVTITEPGNTWDVAIREYCRGYRQRPPWGVATADYHKEGESNEKFGNYQTVFLVRERTKAGVLQAMKAGRMYARQGNFPNLPRLDEFSVSDATGQHQAIMGEAIKINGHPRICIRISSDTTVTNASSPEQKKAIIPGAAATQGVQTVKVRLIRSGALVSEFSGPLPLTVNYEDLYFQPGEKIYYRIDMAGMGKIVANPVFVAFLGEKS